MSTKTSFKRIALVAVAALGFGLVSAVPSNAGTPLANGVVLPTVASVDAPATGTIGSEVTGLFSHNGLTNGYGAEIVSTKVYLVAAPTSSLLSPNAPTVAAYTGTTYTNTTGVTSAATDSNAWGNDNDYNKVWKSTINTAPAQGSTARITSYFKVSFTPDKAGTYSIAVKNQQDALQVVTWTVTVAAPTTASATAFINTTTASAPTADTAAASLVASATASATPVARLTVRQYSTTDTTTAIASGYASAVTATVAGAGILGAANDGSNRSSVGFSALAAGTGVNDFYLYADGRTGTSTITITVGTTVITKTFTFYGTLSTYARSADDLPKTHIGIGETDVMNIVGKDSTGNLTDSAGTIYAKSSDATIASVSVSSQAVTVTGVKSGTATITVCNTADCVSATKSVTIPVAVAKTSAASFTLSFDKAEYTPGEKMTITVKAVDSNGAGVADGSRNLFSSAGITSNASLTGATWTAAAAVTLVAGVKTYTVYAPLVPGTVSIMATQGTAVDAVALGGTAAVVSATATVLSDGVAQAAADAAAEATDAANAATDAANAAAEAADAATAAAQDAADAVAALATSVTAMVDALKKQITALTNLVIKIQKKVKA
jgi:F0F1-type ATP synthase epsilon subunit